MRTTWAAEVRSRPFIHPTSDLFSSAQELSGVQKLLGRRLYRVANPQTI
jgi:hypothetical protein